MICVSECARDDGPGLIPRHPVFVMEYTLKFDHCNRRMRVIQLDRHLLGEVVPVLIRPSKATDNVLERTGNEKYC